MMPTANRFSDRAATVLSAGAAALLAFVILAPDQPAPPDSVDAPIVAEAPAPAPTPPPAAIALPAPPPLPAPSAPAAPPVAARMPKPAVTVTALRPTPPPVPDQPAPPPVTQVPVELTPMRPAPPPPESAPVTESPIRPDPESSPEPEVTVSEHASDTAQPLRQGRALLRLLEQDVGPDLRIAWPADPEERERLYRILTACFGMKSVLMNRDGLLYTASGPAGVGHSPDVGRFSGFVRAVEGDMPAAEKRNLTPVFRHHGLTERTVQPVRLFPRRADAMLLGGLAALLGGRLPKGQRIEARYTLQGGGVAVTDIRRDGAPIPGRIRLESRPGCGAAA